MSQGQLLSDGLSGLFGPERTDWFVSFHVAVSGLTAEQAARVPRPGFNSVWVLVNHIAFWQDGILKRLQGKPFSIDNVQDWEQPRDPTDEAEWQAACARAIDLNDALSKQVAAMSDDELARPLESWEGDLTHAVQGLIAHNSYHICEIVSVRHMQDWWLEET